MRFFNFNDHVTGIDLSDIDAAAYSLMKRPRVRAKFKDDREARITDFHFEIIDMDGQRIDKVLVTISQELKESLEA